jgi:hypothetical protein
MAEHLSVLDRMRKGTPDWLTRSMQPRDGDDRIALNRGRADQSP